MNEVGRKIVFNNLQLQKGNGQRKIQKELAKNLELFKVLPNLKEFDETFNYRLLAVCSTARYWKFTPILSLYTFVFCKAEIVSAGNQRWKIRKTVILRWKNEGQVTDSG